MEEKPMISYVEEREKTVTEYASRQTVGESFGGKRVRQTADVKHGEGSVKRRKVEHAEVQEVSELLRLRMVGRSIKPEKVAELLSYRVGSGAAGQQGWN